MLYDENTTTKRVEIKKDFKIHKQVTDDADVIRAQTEAKKTKNDLVVFVTIMGSFLLLMLLMIGVPALIDKANESSGKIQAGYYKDLVGEDYRTVQAHFEAAGFTNIELIDLNDSGILFWNEGKVETISVGGDTSFESVDWFEPDTKVVISYH